MGKSTQQHETWVTTDMANFAVSTVFTRFKWNFLTQRYVELGLILANSKLSTRSVKGQDVLSVVRIRNGS